MFLIFFPKLNPVVCSSTFSRLHVELLMYGGVANVSRSGVRCDQGRGIESLLALLFLGFYRSHDRKHMHLRVGGLAQSRVSACASSSYMTQNASYRRSRCVVHANRPWLLSREIRSTYPWAMALLLFLFSPRRRENQGKFVRN